MLLPNRLLYELPLPYNYGTRCYTGMQYRCSLLYELPLPYNYGTRCYTGMQYRCSLLYELPLPYNYGTRCYTGMQYRCSLLYELPLPYNNMTGARSLNRGDPRTSQVAWTEQTPQPWVGVQFSPVLTGCFPGLSPAKQPPPDCGPDPGHFEQPPGLAVETRLPGF